MKIWRLYSVLLVVLLTFYVNYGQQIANNPGALNKKLFSFGVIADIQYADVERQGLQNYRSSFYKLKKCVNELNGHNLAFTINLGDLIDRDYSNFNETLPIPCNLKCPIYNVIGNHDFSVDGQFKSKVRQALNNKKGYFDFKIKGVIFMALDGSDISTFSHEKGSKKNGLAMKVYEKLKKEDANKAYLWNGAIGSKQLTWLENKLQKADQICKKIVIYCHWPLLPENGTQL